MSDDTWPAPLCTCGAPLVSVPCLWCEILARVDLPCGVCGGSGVVLVCSLTRQRTCAMGKLEEVMGDEG